MIGAVAAGVIAAVVVTIPSLAQARVEGVFSPVLILGIAMVAMVIQRFVVDRRSGSRAYDGLADLFIHIHSPSNPDFALRWGLRGFISLLLSVCGGAVGPEGAAIEWAQGVAIRSRGRMSRWFEQRRRTDASCALSAGVSAAFGAPLAGLLLPVELGMGGRYVLSAVSALVAFLGARYLRSALGLPAPDLAGALYGTRLIEPAALLGALVIGTGAGAVSAGLIRFFRYAQDSLLDLFQTQTWMRTLAAGVLLFLAILTYHPAHEPWSSLLEQVLSGRLPPSETWLLFSAGVLSLAVILAGFGTLGIFWPLLALGGFFGHGLASSVGHDWGGPVALAGFSGAAALWGAILGTPIAGAAVAFELTGNPSVLLPCLLASLVAREVRARLRTRPLYECDLDARGMRLIDGRAAGVLEGISVRDAMVTDHEIVHEQEPVSDIHPRLLKSRYPFLPVVNSQNVYVGLLTVDMVQEAWQQESPNSNSPLAKLLEAKDLLYRSGAKSPTVRVNDRLSMIGGVFADGPCVPVLTDDGRVTGLLFVHNVRLAYDREVARRSLAFEDRDT